MCLMLDPKNNSISKSNNSPYNLSINNSQNIPILYGVLTTLNYQQALARTKKDKSNKGYEVMDSAICMINQFSSLNK